jgi:signal peptidase I
MTAATPTTDPEQIPSRPVVAAYGRKPRGLAPVILRQAAQALGFAILAVASYFVISRFLLQSVKVVGRSMVPTLSDSQHYLLNRWVYYFHSPRHSDIVVLRDPADNGFSVKRVVATPGESVYLKEGNVYVNGCKLHEPYLAPGTPTFTDSQYRDQLILCGKDQFFLLGDNRQNSIDSRTYGPVPRKNILGPIVW